MNTDSISRKNFLKLLGVGLTSVGIKPVLNINHGTKFPDYDRLGRVCIIGRVDIKSAPFEGSQTVGVLYEDAVFPWLRGVVAKEPNLNLFNQRWIEMPDGFVFADNIQPVKNISNQPIDNLPPSSLGGGMWAEVTVPYADVTLVNGPSSNSWVHARIDQGLPLRVYYSQVYYIDQIKTDEYGGIFYRANPNYYGGVDMLWVPAEAMRPIPPEELTPINPNVENKKIIVDVKKQTLSCFEGDTEIFYCRVSTGLPYESMATPIGSFLTSRKFISLQMSGGTSGAPYDLPGIGWVSIFATGGVAIHATVWHNVFGAPKSHGCVNALPDDAKWIFRWGLPHTPYDPGMVDISESGDPSTKVQVIES